MNTRLRLFDADDNGPVRWLGFIFLRTGDAQNVMLLPDLMFSRLENFPMTMRVSYRESSTFTPHSSHITG